MAAATASQSGIQPSRAARPAAISVTSLGTGMQALSGIISKKTPSGPSLVGLADAGLIERQPVAEDRRRQALVLSQQGETAFGSAEALLRRRLGGLLTDLPHPEADALARLLPRVEAALSGAPPPRRPPPPPPPPHRRPRRAR